MSDAVAKRDPAVPVVEVFGPTIQGEGPLAGLPTHFIRVAGCDYRCSWCDSPHAVLPKLWKGTPRRHASEIVEQVNDLTAGPRWVTISGGNPAMYDLGRLLEELHASGYAVALETQGSIWKPWMTFIDMLVISPKPPSSGMMQKTQEDFPGFLASAVRTGAREAATAVKIVVFTNEDYEWAMELFPAIRPTWMRYLSLGTTVAGATLEQLDAPRPQREWSDAALEMAAGYQLLCERVASDPRCADVRVLPQLHVLAWGDKVGV